MRTIYSKYDKTQIGALPRINFEGRIIVLLTEQEAEKAVDYLLQQELLGVDTETRPIFKRGRQNKVALLQVSTDDTCFLFRLNRMGLCAPVKRLLEAETPKKIGLSWHDDLMMLHKRGAFSEAGFIDLQDHMKELGIEDPKLYANIFGQRISKREQLSNWEADALNEKQKKYAATDAWACIQLYKEYERLKETGDYELIVVKKEEPAGPDSPDSPDSPINPETPVSDEQTSVS